MSDELPVVSSALTAAELRAVVVDCGDYDQSGGSLAKVRAFIKAARGLLALGLRRSQGAGRGGEEIELDPNKLEEMLRKAERWHAAKSRSSAGPRQFVPDDDYRS